MHNMKIILLTLISSILLADSFIIKEADYYVNTDEGSYKRGEVIPFNQEISLYNGDHAKFVNKYFSIKVEGESIFTIIKKENTYILKVLEGSFKIEQMIYSPEITLKIVSDSFEIDSDKYNLLLSVSNSKINVVNLKEDIYFLVREPLLRKFSVKSNSLINYNRFELPLIKPIKSNIIKKLSSGRTF